MKRYEIDIELRKLANAFAKYMTTTVTMTMKYCSPKHN